LTKYFSCALASRTDRFVNPVKNNNCQQKRSAGFGFCLKQVTRQSFSGGGHRLLMSNKDQPV